MTEEMPGLGDPVIRRLQQAFADEDPASDLPAVMQRAARYQAAEPEGAHGALQGHVVTTADLVAARRREPAAVTRLYTAYAPALFRFFMASVGDRHLAEDLTGATFVSAIEALPRFPGPVESLGGWLFQIARHDLYDHRRKQNRSRTEPLEENLGAESALGSAPAARETLDLLAKGWSSGREERGALAMEPLEGTDVMAALEALPAEQREVLLLQMVAGLTAAEVATALGKTVNAVKALRHRGLSRLSRTLGPQSLEHWQDRPSSPGPDHPDNLRERHR